MSGIWDNWSSSAHYCVCQMCVRKGVFERQIKCFWTIQFLCYLVVSNVNRYDIVARVKEWWLPHLRNKNANLTLCHTSLLARKLLSKQLFNLDIWKSENSECEAWNYMYVYPSTPLMGIVSSTEIFISKTMTMILILRLMKHCKERTT